MGIKLSKRKGTRIQNDLREVKRAQDCNDATWSVNADPQLPIARFTPRNLRSKERSQIIKHVDFGDDQENEIQNDTTCICKDAFECQESYGGSNILETCAVHLEKVHKFWCKNCKVPVCNMCADHSNHDVIDAQEAYERKITENKRAFNTISRWILPLNLSMKAKTQKDIDKCCALSKEKFGNMLVKSMGLKNLLDIFISQDCAYISRKLVNKTNSLLRKQMTSTDLHYKRLEKFCEKYEQLANKPVKFLLFLSRKPFRSLKQVPENVSNLSLTSFDDTSNKILMLEILADFIIKENKTKHTKEKMMHKPILVSSLQMTDIARVCHIICVTPNLIWISDYKYNLILMSIIENKLSVAYRVGDECWGLGVYTVSDTGDLIYIDRRSSINKLSTDCETNESLFQIKNDWRPRCIYYSHLKRDLIIGMWKEKRCRIVRYDTSGKKIQNSENENPTLYKYPAYITENWNGDVIVADLDKHAVVVTDQQGAYRFSYEGPPNESQLDPRGVCTDGLGHILVSDWTSRSVQIVDKDGVFLSTLLTASNTDNPPYGLCYEEANHLLWVGYDNSNKVTVFKYLN